MPVVIPDEIVQAAGITEQELVQTLAVALFEQGRLSLGRHREIHCIRRVDSSLCLWCNWEPCY